MEKFEYISGSKLCDKQLNELGEGGWDLVAVTVISDFNERFYFKREIIKKD